MTPEAQLWEIQKELSKLVVSDDVLDRPFESLSNGEQTKVLLAALFLRGHNFLLIDEPTNHFSLCEQAHLYIWDEPLNYIDVYSRMQIEDLILAHRPTLFFVEHDKGFCEKIATESVLLRCQSQ
jgi:lincosamide and streptogramin A transport system ATP-binding/permease protein